MGDRTDVRARIQTFTPARLRALLGPAEGQYGPPPQTLTLGLRGANGAALACGTTIVDESPEDLAPGLVSTVGVLFVWNDLAGETGFRAQFDANSATFVTENLFVEHAANVTQSQLFTGFGVTGPPQTNTGRVFGHVGHVPGHGSAPIAGDVVSNECSVTFTVP